MNGRRKRKTGDLIEGASNLGKSRRKIKKE
jgi:hypothetical protein